MTDELELAVAQAICCPDKCICREIKAECPPFQKDILKARAAIAVMGKAKVEQQSGLRFSDALGHMRDGLLMRRAEWPAHVYTCIPENRLVILLCRGDEPGVPWRITSAQILAGDWEAYNKE